MDPVKFVGGLISAHPYWTLGLVIAWWLVSNAVSAMPSPDQSSGKGYKWLFSLGHGLMGSLPRIFPALRFPWDPSRSTQPFFAPPTSPNPPAPPAP